MEVDTTVLIKTINRPDKLYDCVSNIRKKYYFIKIIILDDGLNNVENANKLINEFNNVVYITTDYDIGCSKGRNILVNMVKTKYFILLDDDTLLDKSTDVNKIYDIMEESDFDILGGRMKVNEKRIVDYNMTFEVKDNFLYGHNKHKYIDKNIKCYDIILNNYIARTESFLNKPFRNELKIGEHTAFFYDYNNSLKVGCYEKFIFINKSGGERNYASLRSRASLYFNEFLKSEKLEGYYRTKVSPTKTYLDNKLKIDLKKDFNVNGVIHFRDYKIKCVFDKNNKKMSKINLSTFLSNYNLINDVLIKNTNKKAWLTDGSLLGYYRENGLINHDNDTDIGFFYDDWDDKLLSKFIDKGFKILYDWRIDGKTHELSLHKNNIKTDIFLFKKENNKYFHTAFLKEKGKYNIIKYYYDDNLLELQESYFYCNKVTVPKNILNYIITKYGYKWFIIDESYHWSFSPHNFVKTDKYISSNSLNRKIPIKKINIRNKTINIGDNFVTNYHNLDDYSILNSIIIWHDNEQLIPEYLFKHNIIYYYINNIVAVDNDKLNILKSNLDKVKNIFTSSMDLFNNKQIMKHYTFDINKVIYVNPFTSNKYDNINKIDKICIPGNNKIIPNSFKYYIGYISKNGFIKSDNFYDYRICVDSYNDYNKIPEYFLDICMSKSLLVINYNHNLEKIGFIDGVNCIYINKNNIKKQILKILNMSDDKINNIIEKGYEHVSKNFTLDNFNKNIKQIIYNLKIS